MSLYVIVPLAAHFAVLGIGLAAVLHRVALPRGARSGVGLVLMALSMIALAAGPPLHLQTAAAIVFLATFAPGLWAVVGPVRTPPSPLWDRG